ncbi:MAG: hypothetical protein AAF843_12510 [Bacteroidota bacterium]
MSGLFNRRNIIVLLGFIVVIIIALSLRAEGTGLIASVFSLR